ncbi:MAG: YggU family protein [Burkholderiales bacterium]|nr:YggU family protein [Burkholderiales bacterium]MBP9768243.1 YggU family protein [Burkholderiales bacterium]
MFTIKSETLLIVDVYVQPGAKVSQIIGKHGERLKIKISSPPVDGKANQAVIEFFAKLFNLAKRDVNIESGDKSRSKRVSLIGDVTIFIQQIEGLIND